MRKVMSSKELGPASRDLQDAIGQLLKASESYFGMVMNKSWARDGAEGLGKMERAQNDMDHAN